MTKKRILIFGEFYLPSTGGGGGKWLAVNLVERFADRYDFFVGVGNRHGRGLDDELSGIEINAWNRIGAANVFFVARRTPTSRQIRSIVEDVRPDAVFLNSAFSKPTIHFLRERKKGFSIDPAVIVSPCGELLPHSLANKPAKKRVFLALARLFRLYDGVIWRASFEREAEAIKSIFGDGAWVAIASDPTPKTILPDFKVENKPGKRAGHVKFVFVGRVVRVKNVHFFIERLAEIGDARVEFEIIGTIEDEDYWAVCEAAIKRLPPNVSVTLAGTVTNDEVMKRLTGAHFAVLPTLGENFGYVVIEALGAGSPILMSDRTDWMTIESKSAGWTVSLEDKSAWRRAIEQCAAMTGDEYTEMAAAARRFAVEWLAAPENETATAELLRFATSARAGGGAR